MEAYLQYQQSSLHYHLYGSGPLLVLLHGYNHHTQSFYFLKKYLEDRFTVLAIDMPFHGFTNWQEQRAFTPEDLHKILLQLQPQAAHELHLLGYSMGGRLALAYFQDYPEAVKSISLIAPDGFRVNPWYRLATQSKAGVRFFHNTMHNPAWLHRFIYIGKRMKMIKPGLGNTAMYFLKNPDARMELYNRWTSLSTFRTNLRRIRLLLQKQQVPLKILYGKSDPVVSYKDGLRFQKTCPQQVHIHIVAAGHFLIGERYAQEIVKLLPES